MTFQLQIPTKQSHSVVLSAPHCGKRFPDAFLEQSPLSQKALLETGDLGTDVLVDSLPELASIKAGYARSFVDLNRARDQLDKTVVAGLDRPHDMQTLSGYGVIPRFARSGALTHAGKISHDEAENRLCQFYDPYHQALTGLIEDAKRQEGRVLLIDVHSAPYAVLGETDIQIGSLHGGSCRPVIRDYAAEVFEGASFNVALELPFAGGYITQAYCRDPLVEVLQIEVNRRHCVDENNEVVLHLEHSFVAQWRSCMQKIIHNFSENLHFDNS